MTTQQAPQQQTVVTIHKVGTVMGKHGPQWELAASWPWSNNYQGKLLTDTIWIEKSEMPDEPQPNAYQVMIEKKSLKKKKDGSFYDGTLPWMFNYHIVQWLSAAPLSTQAALPSQQPIAAQPGALKIVPTGSEIGAPGPNEQKTNFDTTREKGIDINVAINQGREAAQFHLNAVGFDGNAGEGSKRDFEREFLALWQKYANEVIKMQRKAKGVG